MIMLFLVLILFKSVFFGFEKGYKRIVVLGSPKTYCCQVVAKPHSFEK